jgi:hypothetical protein
LAWGVVSFDSRTARARHLCPKLWLLCHLGVYYFEFEFEKPQSEKDWIRMFVRYRNLDDIYESIAMRRTIGPWCCVEKTSRAISAHAQCAFLLSFANGKYELVPIS